VSNNPTAPRIDIELGGKTRTLLLDFNALADFEEATGVNVLQTGFDEFGARHMRALIWAGLLHEEPDVTIRQVGSWLSGANMKSIMESVERATKDHISEETAVEMPVGPEGRPTGPEEPAEPDGRAPTGSPSGASVESTLD